MLKVKKEDIFTIPNILTYIRLLLVPVFVVVFFKGGEFAEFYALAIFAVAEITDIVDGKIARKFNMITDIGRVFDPLADKLLQVATVICLSIGGYVHWIFAVILFVKELYMIVGSYLLAKHNCIGQANKWGKLAASILGYGFIGCFFHKLMIEQVWQYFYFDWLIIGIGLCVSLYAAYDYTYKAVVLLKNRGPIEVERFEIDYSLSFEEAVKEGEAATGKDENEDDDKDSKSE